MSESRAPFHPFPKGNRLGMALLALTAIMVTYGTIMVASASEGLASAGGSTFGPLVKDLFYLGIGIGVLLLMACVRIGLLLRFAPWLIGGGVVLLAAVQKLGVEVDGGRRWLSLPGFELQPSELFKFFVLIYVAWVLERHHNRIGDWQHLVVWTLPILAGLGFIMLEHDLGTGSVIGAIAVTMLGVAGLARRYLSSIAVLALVAGLVYSQFFKYSFDRFVAFLHPNANLATSGYQLLQSKIGLGAGGLLGLGFGQSREKWGLLPNPHTDFIFSIIGEELGLIGTLAVVGLFVAFLMLGTRIARQCTNEVYRLISVGITTWLVLEAVINIASVVGGWAVTGIPLPFFSYGGSAMITELAAVGLLYNIAHDQSHSATIAIRADVAPLVALQTPARPPARPATSTHRQPVRPRRP